MAAARSAALLLLACWVATSFVAHGFPREEGWNEHHAQPASTQKAQFHTQEDNWEEKLLRTEMKPRSLIGAKAARVSNQHSQLIGASTKQSQQTSVNSQRKNAAKIFGTFAKQADEQGIVDEPLAAAGSQLQAPSQVFPQARRRSQFKIGPGNQFKVDPNVINEESAQPQHNGQEPAIGTRVVNEGVARQPKPEPNPVQVYDPSTQTETKTPVHSEKPVAQFVPNTPQPAAEPSFKRAQPQPLNKAQPAAKSNSDSSDEGNTTTMWIAIAISVVLLILAMFLCWFCLQKEEQEKKAKGTQKLVDDEGQPNVEEDTDPNAWTNRNALGLNDQNTPWYLRDESGKINFSKPQFTKSTAAPATKTGDASTSSTSEGNSNANSANADSGNAGKVTFSK